MITDHEPPEPPAPEGRRPHRERIADIIRLCPVGKVAAVCVDDEPAPRDYYRYHLVRAAGQGISILSEGKAVEVEGVYVFRITKTLGEAVERCREHMKARNPRPCGAPYKIEWRDPDSNETLTVSLWFQEGEIAYEAGLKEFLEEMGGSE